MSTITQDGITWVTMSTNLNNLIYQGLFHAINNCEGLDKATLVDKINRKIANKAGVQVPESLIINVKPVTFPKVKTTKNKSENTSGQSRVKKEIVQKEVLIITDKEVITIIGKPANGKLILANRKMVVTGQKNGAYIGFLINEKDGSLQRSEITMQVEFTSKANQKAIQ